LRDLLLRVPATSKVLLTSRVGIGELEARYPLQGLEETAAIVLFRALARILSVDALLRLDDGNIKGFCKRLFFNPLLIKWFVAGVSRGSSPSKLINRDGVEFGEALAFCFNNLFEKLGVSERAVVDCLVSARRPLTSAEIHFLMPQLSTLEVEIALIALHNSSIVLRTKEGREGFEYSLTESTTTFIGLNAPPSQALFKQTQDRLRDLRLILTQESILEGRYEYDPFFVRSGDSRDDRICATYLRRALDLLRKSAFEEARSQISEAKRLASQSAEVWRIAALVEDLAADHYKAFENYEHAVDLDPHSRICRYCFGMFLLTDMDDLDGALQQFIAAEALDPGAAPILTAKAMALMRSGRLEEAARIHDQLLPTLGQRERRWRLTGSDQAADCYRRWAHRTWEMKEYQAAEQHLKRAMSILLNAAERGDCDEKLLQRTARVLNECFHKRELVVNTELVEYLLVSAERMHSLAKTSLPIRSEMAWVLRNTDLPVSLRDRLARLDGPITTAGVAPGTQVNPSEDNFQQTKQHFGHVHTLQARFGFISEVDGRRWFFHRNFLRHGTLWENLAIGKRVAFEIGQNSQGECAVEVWEAPPAERPHDV